ncbi:MAG: 50S ribosomal protein L22 [Candidatus Magasanikbacteria bacterium CG_4_9_14_0_2_um_filter_42_11]|uniref:Large ribosomal subunit protein uL22 n=1 Tax=Candidatus Magasanikbacteria bacterium CG_4_9_14_0_2_um_filter_42_11 TaxID=1974643 RepID=A0A2M8F8L0_9BACT|nr:MAG: 50S ribosomal protein L22 [Candidatus Magasanikbacteria bacterium CG10_big_fil_rev_8_21_14_0_10_43_9]PIY92450.1 MAG: 50S ribosomal protein L22 [Candidatus Magasanikbacteria bacterium CG_4_10_14_0_8_um_filter_42_12]PJC52070.1 MAG: 50S ribosomal protein L22 [Candidatus Magasanikbacteria bacterium CG_4_9_14_0_2_um_filter_42_11]
MKRQATAKLNNLRVAPRKVRLLVDLIRGMHVAEALMQLKFSKKHAATSVMKLLRSAVANAEHNADIDIDTLIVKEAYVDGGPILYRWMPRAFGRAGKIRKRTSHITIVLEGDEKTKKAAKEKKETKKETKKTKEKKGTEETA